MKLSEHFDSREFACHCGCNWGNSGAAIHPKLIEALERIRHRLGDIPLEINSGVRCPAHNMNVGGVSNSRHVMLDAADVATPLGIDSTTLAEIAAEEGVDGIGVYEYFVHMDMRGWEARW